MNGNIPVINYGNFPSPLLFLAAKNKPEIYPFGLQIVYDWDGSNSGRE